MPTLNDKGERIILFRAIYDPSKTKQEHVFKTVSIFVDILLNEDDNFVIAGYHSIVDLNLATMDHCTVFSPGTTAKFIKIFREAYPLRIKGVHFIGTPSFFDFVYSLFKNAFSEKLLKRVSRSTSLRPSGSFSQCNTVDFFIDYVDLKNQLFYKRPTEYKLIPKFMYAF